MNKAAKGRIFFCGDVHGNFKHVIEAVRKHRPEAMVFLGCIPKIELHRHYLYIYRPSDIYGAKGKADRVMNQRIGNSEASVREINQPSVFIINSVTTLVGVGNEK